MMTEFSEKLKAMRLHKKLTAKQVYEAAEIFPSYYYRLESGKAGDPTISTIRNLSKILGVKEEYFVNDLTPSEMDSFSRGYPLVKEVALLNDDKWTQHILEVVAALRVSREIDALKSRA